ncbi:hypothetical protein [Bacillus sp. C1]
MYKDLLQDNYHHQEDKLKRRIEQTWSVYGNGIYNDCEKAISSHECNIDGGVHI